MSKIKVNSLEGVGASTPAISIDNASGTCTASITNNLSNRNKVINGSMIVNQRGDQSATGSAGYFACDRFKTVNGCGAQVAISQSTDTPDGFGNSMKWDCTTADTSIAASDFFIVRYGFEGRDLQDMQKGTSSAKKVVLSFYAKATKTGTYIVELIDHDNSSRHVNKSYTISDTNWNRYTISFPADTTGAFDNDSNKSMDINFWLVAGSTYNSGTLQTAWGADTNANRAVGQVNAMDSTSNDFYLTGVQLEVDHTGSGKATDFEHRSFPEELLLCQRYCQKLGGGNGIYDCMAIGNGVYNTKAFVPYKLVTTMRSTPSFTLIGSASDFKYSRDGSDYTPSSVALDAASINMIAVLFTVSTGISNDEAIRVWNTNNTGGYLFTAEL